MKQDRSVRFDVLEGRALLTKLHPAAAPAKGPIAIVGTLAVDDSDKTSNMNSDGSWTTSVPIAGNLGALGEVKGVWNETVDYTGNYEGPDVLRLTNSSGTVYLTFNNATHGPAHKVAPGTLEFEHVQHLYLGTGTYAKATEVGTVGIVSNAAESNVKSLVLAPKTT